MHSYPVPLFMHFLALTQGRLSHGRSKKNTHRAQLLFSFNYVEDGAQTNILLTLHSLPAILGEFHCRVFTRDCIDLRIKGQGVHLKFKLITACCIIL